MSVTFTRHVAGTYNPETDTETGGSSTTIVGSAFAKMSGAEEIFGAGTIITESQRLLLFTPTTYGQYPVQGDTVVWEGLTWNVRKVKTLAPDGVAILSYALVER